ncbi:MAG: hypothetical protein E7012_03740 [Alphaproteobacteria bacterium]|nr:hypothetical protein [Alphaproteobacteria bacterium]
MPFLTVYSNTEIKDEKIVQDAAELVAKQLGKPIRYVVVNVINNENMAFEGSVKNKGALVEMQSIGFGDKDVLVKSLTDLLVERLQVERGLVNIHLTDMPASTVAIGGNLLG